MSLAGVVEDLLALQRLAEGERDARRRQVLDEVRQHVVDRDRGAKVGEAAQVLGVSAPTVRAWIEAGALQAVAGSRPVRVGVMSLAETKSILDELRRHRDDRHLLADVSRGLRDRGVRAGEDGAEGVDDPAAGRVHRLERAGIEDVLSGVTLHPLNEGWSPFLCGQSVRMRVCRRVSLATGNRAVPSRRSQTWSWGYNSSVRRTVGAVVLMVVLTACGGGEGGDSETQFPSETSSTAPSTTTSTTQAKPSATAAGATCADLAAKAVQLVKDYRATMRGIAGPTREDEAKLRARELALRAEARSLGCPVPREMLSDQIRESPP
jgi:excisionase family DNA binding protein